MTDNTRQYGLDLLKALSIVFVMLWHLQLFRIHMSSNALLPLLLVKFIHLFYSISLTAVPTFYLVSLFLYYSKHADDSFYFRYRLKRIFTIFSFWTGIQFFLFFLTIKIHYGFFPSLRSALAFMNGSSDTHSTLYFIIHTIMIGGPRLPVPHSGASVFYFLFDMCILTIIAFCYRKIKNIRARQIIGLSVIAISLVHFELNNLYGDQIVYWRLDNFIIYIPLADLLDLNKSTFIKHRKLFFLAFVLFLLHDQLIGATIHSRFPYGRIATVFGTLTLVSFFFHPNQKKRRLILFLSTYSLGLFAMHRYWHLIMIPIFEKIFDFVDLSMYAMILFIPINFFWFMVGVATILTTLITVRLFGMTPLRKFVC